MTNERPRLLHQRSQFGYTDRYVEAMSDEPEAVPADYQRELTRRAQRSEEERQRDEFADALKRISTALDDLAPFVDRSQVRAMRRQFKRLGHLP